MSKLLRVQGAIVGMTQTEAYAPSAEGFFEWTRIPCSALVGTRERVISSINANVQRLMMCEGQAGSIK